MKRRGRNAAAAAGGMTLPRARREAALIPRSRERRSPGHRVRTGENHVLVALLLRRRRGAPIEIGGKRVPETAGDPQAVQGMQGKSRGRTAAAGGGMTLPRALNEAAPIPRSRERRSPGLRARRERGGGSPPLAVAGTAEVPGMKWMASVPEVPGGGGTPQNRGALGGRRRRWRRSNRTRRNPA